MDKPNAVALLILLLSLITLSGCESLLQGDDRNARAPSPSSDMTAGIDNRAATQQPPWELPGSPIYQRVIYFAHGHSDILPEYVPLLQTHATYLVQHPKTHVRIEGHTDERGTRGYQLALGERRAEAVRQFLLAEGVPETQLETRSYGEERPESTEHSESAWSRNRRVELVYQSSRK